MPKTRRTVLEVDQQTIDAWVADTGAAEIDMREVAKWGMARGRFHRRPYDPVKEYAKRLSRAAREQQYVDPQGRDVRQKHCFVIIDDTGQRQWRWVDITTAKPDKMRLAFQQRRRSALGDVVQLNKDLQSFNDNNKYGVQLEFSFNFDEDLAELAEPTEYPDE